ncbi:MAG: hypothetical protein DWQ49_00690 [Bacteroidetes bacterium]|jgi:hypothetical protein|nr:MAG: hypothetical protein DWQ49_00690 [Bacteroidota bacterium]
MTDTQKAAPISATDFVKAYVTTHQSGGTIADLATALNRSVEQVRAKRNSISAQLKSRGQSLPSLKRMERDSSAYDEAASIVGDYLSTLMGESDSHEQG